MVTHWLLLANCTTSFFIWVPTWVKLNRTQSAGDYALGTFVLIAALQVSSLVLAVLTHSWPFVVYYAVNATIVGLTLGYIWRLRG